MMRKGERQLITWLERNHVTTVHACMEATSIYGSALVEFLYEAGHIVSIVNPVRIKGFALRRTAPHQNRQGGCGPDCPLLLGSPSGGLGALAPRSETTTGAFEALGVTNGDTTAPKKPSGNGNRRHRARQLKATWSILKSRSTRPRR